MQKIIRFQNSYIEPYPLQVQGESFYRKNLEEVSHYMGDEEGVNADDFIARLILDDDNKYDPGNAVRVEIDGKTVGHLSKPGAKKYRKRLETLGFFDVIGECYASIKGGFLTRDGHYADFGVRLDLDLDTFDDVLAMPKAKPGEPAVNSRAPTGEVFVSSQIPPSAQDQMLAEKAKSIAERGGSIYVSSGPSTRKPVWKRVSDWFFSPSKYRVWRIILLFFLAAFACGECQIIISAITGKP